VTPNEWWCRATPSGAGPFPKKKKGGGKEEELPAPKGTKACVEMINPAAHELDWHDLPAEPLAEDWEPSDVRPLTVPAKPSLGEPEQIARSFEEQLLLQRQHLESV